jgi:hypothetical protein
MPLPKGCDRLVDPSDLFVIVPEPNLLVVPVRGCVSVDRGGVGSAACVAVMEPNRIAAAASQLDRERGVFIGLSPEGDRMTASTNLGIIG